MRNRVFAEDLAPRGDVPHPGLFRFGQVYTVEKVLHHCPAIRALFVTLDIADEAGPSRISGEPVEMFQHEFPAEFLHANRGKRRTMGLDVLSWNDCKLREQVDGNREIEGAVRIDSGPAFRQGPHGIPTGQTGSTREPHP